MTRSRTLIWDGCVNVRDLGGHPTANGETRFGRIVRADLIRRLSDDGWEALLAYGVRSIVDLRHQQEVDADEPPHELAVDVVHVPLFPDPASPDWPEIDVIGRKAGVGAPGTRAVYGELLRRFPDRMAAAVSAVADAPEGGVVVHCMAGKDRTGLVTALLLRLAGVPSEAIGEDYAVTEINLREATERWIAEAQTDEERDFRRRVSGTPAEAMVGVLEELEERHGDVGAYLQAGGATPAAIGAVRARLLE